MRAFRLLLVFLCLSLGAGAYAESTLAVRIDLAGRQRMLSQRMARAACFVANGIEVQTNKQILLASRSLFGNSLRQLKMGGGDEALTQETNEEALSDIASIEKTWFKMQRKVTRFMKPENVTLEDLVAFSDVSVDLLTESNYLVITLQNLAQSEGETLDPVVANWINVSGRQRMLIQKIGKEACLLQAMRLSGHGNDELDATAFSTTMDVFLSSAFALAFGDSYLGLPEAPTEEIFYIGGDNWQRWSMVSALISGAMYGLLTEKDMIELSWDLEAFMADLNAATQLYSKL